MQYKKQSSKCFPRYCLETEFIIVNQVNNRLKIKVKKLFKVHNSQKAQLHPLRDVCMQYENNPANAFRDIVRKRNTTAWPDMVMTFVGEG